MDYFNEDFLSEKEIKTSKRNILIGTLFSFLIIISIFIFFIYKVLLTDSTFFSPGEDLLKEISSPDNKYKIQAFLIKGGATTDFGVKCSLFIDGKEEKTIYSDYHIKEANINWIDNDTVSINSHIINLPDGEYNWTSNK